MKKKGIEIADEFRPDSWMKKCRKREWQKLLRWILQLHKDVPKAARFYYAGLGFDIHSCTLRSAELQSDYKRLQLSDFPFYDKIHLYIHDALMKHNRVSAAAEFARTHNLDLTQKLEIDVPESFFYWWIRGIRRNMILRRRLANNVTPESSCVDNVAVAEEIDDNIEIRQNTLGKRKSNDQTVKEVAAMEREKLEAKKRRRNDVATSASSASSAQPVTQLPSHPYAQPVHMYAPFPSYLHVPLLAFPYPSVLPVAMSTHMVDFHYPYTPPSAYLYPYVPPTLSYSYIPVFSSSTQLVAMSTQTVAASAQPTVTSTQPA